MSKTRSLHREEAERNMLLYLDGERIPTGTTLLVDENAVVSAPIAREIIFKLEREEKIQMIEHGGKGRLWEILPLHFDLYYDDTTLMVELVDKELEDLEPIMKDWEELGIPQSFEDPKWIDWEKLRARRNILTKLSTEFKKQLGVCVNGE